MLIPLLLATAASSSPHLKLDQFGFLPAAEKLCFITEAHQGFDAPSLYLVGNTLEVRRFDDDMAVFSGPVTVWNGGAVDPTSGDSAHWFDFSALTTPGTYYVFDPAGGGSSPVFDIATGVYRLALRDSLRTFYYQRCGVAKLHPFADSGWTDTACHKGALQDLDCRSVLNPAPSTSLDLSGGWHDAGDYNKYINYADDAVHHLLFAYQETPAAFDDALGIPESHNGVPDILDELRFELEWMLRMQFPNGSVSHKLAALNWDDAESPPSHEGTARQYAPATASATISAAGSFAHAALVFEAQPATAAFGHSLRAAALAAWSWLEANPGAIPSNYNNAGFVNAAAEDDAYTQEMNQTAAAAYLLVLTGDVKYRGFFDAHVAANHLFTYSDLSPYEEPTTSGILTYLASPLATPQVAAQLRSKYDSDMGWHEFNYQGSPNDAYGAYVDGYGWGASRWRCQEGLLFFGSINAGIDPATDADFARYAARSLHAMHGANPLGMAYLTAMDERGTEASVDEFYHVWFGDGTPFDNAKTSQFGPPPGYVPGGPNPYYSAPGTPIVPPMFQPDQKAFKVWNTAADASWEVTENHIPYQAAYVRLVSHFVSAGPTLIQLSPKSLAPLDSLNGTELVLSGVHLDAVTSVELGGISIPQASFLSQTQDEVRLLAPLPTSLSPRSVTLIDSGSKRSSALMLATHEELPPALHLDAPSAPGQSATATWAGPPASLGFLILNGGGNTFSLAGPPPITALLPDLTLFTGATDAAGIDSLTLVPPPSTAGQVIFVQALLLDPISLFLAATPIENLTL